MTAQILDGKVISARVKEEVKARVAAFQHKHGRKPGLEVVLVGADTASHVYVGSKVRTCLETDIRSDVHRLPAEAHQADVLAKLTELNEREDVDGILVQLPLPMDLDAEAVVHAIDPRKDVDGLHPINAGLLATGGRGLRPCTPTGCMRMLAETGKQLAGLRALVVGRSNLVGKPLAFMLLEQNCTVTLAHSLTRDLDQRVAEADIIVAAVGVPGLIKGAWIKPSAIVLDVGMNRIAPGKLVGDVEFEGAKERAAWITPVPGGVGLMTVAILMENTIAAAERRASS